VCCRARAYSTLLCAAAIGRPVNALVTVGDVEELVFVGMLVIDSSDGRACRRYLIVDEEEERVLGSQLDALADEEVKLAHGEVVGHEVFLLVEVSDARFGRFFHDDRHTIGILLADALALLTTSLERLLFFEFPLHCGGAPGAAENR